MKTLLLLFGLLATGAVAQVPIVHMAATTVEVTESAPAALVPLTYDGPPITTALWVYCDLTDGSATGRRKLPRQADRLKVEFPASNALL
ncbi:MAG: hypothetical protein R3D98_10525 [Candidatus Krumholzibacteriia bacterium]